MDPCDYELLDGGDGKKLERFGPYVLVRPCAQAVWRPTQPAAAWAAAHATFDRVEGHRWHYLKPLPKDWEITVDGLRFRLLGTDFGHLGIFPEQRAAWRWIRETVRAACAASGRAPAVLNLFAYSGGATLAAARGGAEVCHLDASRGMVTWARENAGLNGLEQAPIRWIVDDAHKFLGREVRRGRRYDGIILDPPSFGRGQKGELYKIETEITQTLELCRQLLTPSPLFVLLSAHTPGFTPQVLENLLGQACAGLPGRLSSGEMLLTGASAIPPIPSGAFARWCRTAAG